MRHFLTLSTLTLLSSLTAVSADTLGIEVTKAVDCTRKTENGDTITVNYKGTLESDGTKFDSSYDRNQPFEFTLGSHQVIAGWDQGLLGMCIGEGRKLTIPPHLAYGNSQVGKIPAGSTLIFETELMGIEGVQAEPVVPARPTPGRPLEEPKPSTSPAETPVTESQPSPVKEKPDTSAAAAQPKPTASTVAQASPMSEKKGACNLLGYFALIVQGALGLLAVSSLVYKRWREHPRRPIKIWFFDVSKQVFGSVLLHLANILMSMLSSGKFDVDAQTKATQYSGTDPEADEPNPCSFYLLNLAIDTTIGIPILVLLLKLLHRAFLLTPMANPPESIRSGNYGHPPRVTWWLKQSVIYFLGLIGMKLCVLAIFELLPWIAWVGDWALRWTEGNTAIQITFVMFIFPLIMNALQYWIIDGFIKDPAGGENHYVGVDTDESVDDSDDDDHEWLERQRRRLHGEESDLEEANPTPLPVRKREEEYDPDTDGRQGNSRDGTKERRD